MALDPYSTLDVKHDASAADITKAWRTKIRAAHPDRNPDDPHAATRAALINEAYDILRDPERRKAYDSGATENPHAIASEARQFILEKFRTLLSGAQPPNTRGIIDAVAKALAADLKKTKLGIKEGEASNVSLRRMRKRYRRRNGDDSDDFLTEALTAMQGDNDKAIAALKKGVVVVTLALKLIDDFEDVADPDLYGDAEHRLLFISASS